VRGVCCLAREAGCVVGCVVPSVVLVVIPASLLPLVLVLVVWAEALEKVMSAMSAAVPKQDSLFTGRLLRKNLMN
jgi:hypothetical protein